jgi:uncharacterized membrane protein
MEIILIIGVVIFCFFSAIILPWSNRNRISSLEEAIKSFTQKDNKADPLKNSFGQKIQNHQEASQSSVWQSDPISKNQDPEEIVPPKITKTQEKPTPPIKKKINFERQFGALLPVWIGGIALALSGLFLVKYSLENNLLSPAVRVIIGAISGVVLLYLSNLIRLKPNFSNGARISQSLAGAGIAILYLSVFSASRLYGLIPDVVGFLAMAIITATSLVLALRHGAPIAILGMVGGFLTPALLGGNSDSAFSLFIYLYFTASGLMFIARKNKLWWISIPTIIASLSWVLFWVLFKHNPNDGIWLGLFLLTIAATIFFSTNKDSESLGLTKILNYIGFGGSLVLMAFIAGKSGFGFIEWGMFWLLAAGGIALAYFKKETYAFVPFCALLINVAMIFFCGLENQKLLEIALIAFASIYVFGASFLMFKSKSPKFWAKLASGSALAYYLLAYYKLHNLEPFAQTPFFWGIIALTFSAGAVFVITKINQYFNDDLKNELLAIFAIATTSFISLAFFVELQREFFAIAIAGEILAISWISNKTQLASLRKIAGALTALFGMFLFSQLTITLQFAINSILQIHQSLPIIPIAQFPLLQLGFPALAFFVGAYLFKKQKDDDLVRIFEIIATTLTCLMIYYCTRNIFHPNQNTLTIMADLLERGVITNLWFVFGLFCLWISSKFSRITFLWSGLTICVIAILRIIYFDILILNPLWNAQIIFGITIFNSLLIAYFLPLILGYFFYKKLISIKRNQLAGLVGGFLLISAFVLISLNIRHFFQGEFLNSRTASNAEIYSYSAIWLLFGIALLFGGIARQNKMLRYASLSIILLAIGKVFLFDASELEGLYRVFSFLGLGIVLIGLSYFYSKFVFKDSEKS